MTRINTGPGKFKILNKALSFFIFNFDIDGDKIKLEHQAFLTEVVIASLQSGGSIRVIGLTDRSGSIAYNQALSLRRAANTVSFLKSATTIKFNVAQESGFGQDLAAAHGDLIGSSDDFFRSVAILVSNAPTPPPSPSPKPAPAPVLIRRVIERNFVKTENTPLAGGEPDIDFLPILDLFISLTTSNSKAVTEFLAVRNESLPRKVALKPIDLRVNSFTIENSVSVKLEAFLDFTLTFTTMTYEWGVPAPMIRLTTIQSSTFNDKLVSEQKNEVIKPRAEAEQLPFVIPPDA